MHCAAAPGCEFDIDSCLNFLRTHTRFNFSTKAYIEF
jgi:hypothetical protein